MTKEGKDKPVIPVIITGSSSYGYIQSALLSRNEFHNHAYNLCKSKINSLSTQCFYLFSQLSHGCMLYILVIFIEAILRLSAESNIILLLFIWCFTKIGRFYMRNKEDFWYASILLLINSCTRFIIWILWIFYGIFQSRTILIFIVLDSFDVYQMITWLDERFFERWKNKRAERTMDIEAGYTSSSL